MQEKRKEEKGNFERFFNLLRNGRSAGFRMTRLGGHA
jgi:hypothetical protein